MASSISSSWYYPNPTPLARRIENHVAFGNGVEVVGEPENAALGAG